MPEPPPPPDVLHVCPHEDVIGHELLIDMACMCGPSVQAVRWPGGTHAWVVVHHSLDGRELNE